jgi:hypothetical protein
MRVGDNLITLSFRRHKLIRNVIGIQSTCPNDKHVLFLDFDSTTLDKIEKKLLPYNYKHTFYILQSSRNHYHAICLDEFTFGEVCQIQHELKMNQFLMFSVKRGYWVLRVSSKGIKQEPKIVGVFKAIQPDWRHNGTRPIRSYAHWLWLNQLFGMKTIRNLDDNTKLLFDSYNAEKVKK